MGMGRWYLALVRVESGRWLRPTSLTQQGGLQGREGAVHFRKEFQSYEAFTSDGAFVNTFSMSPSACREGPFEAQFPHQENGSNNNNK